MYRHIQEERKNEFHGDDETPKTCLPIQDES
jgi:hypothetical protein